MLEQPPEYTLCDLQNNTNLNQTLDFYKPFIVRASALTLATSSPEKNLHDFEKHQPPNIHPVQMFQNGEYQRDIDMIPSVFANNIRSGRAKLHDMYWAYYNAENTTIEHSLAANHFTKLERMLGLCTTDKNPLTVWAGSSGHVEQLHYDDENNLHFCVCGKKNWKIYAPQSIQSLNYISLYSAWKSLFQNGILPYAGRVDKKTRGGPAMSIQDRESDDKKSVPCMDVQLNAGDCLYCPAGWHHEVTTVKGQREEMIKTATSFNGGDDNDGDDQVDFVYSLNRFYTTSICSLMRPTSLWSCYVVARLRIFHYFSGRCCHRQ
jgi:hypothetical protein